MAAQMGLPAPTSAPAAADEPAPAGGADLPWQYNKVAIEASSPVPRRKAPPPPVGAINTGVGGVDYDTGASATSPTSVSPLASTPSRSLMHSPEPARAGGALGSSGSSSNLIATGKLPPPAGRRGAGHWMHTLVGRRLPATDKSVGDLLLAVFFIGLNVAAYFAGSDTDPALKLGTVGSAAEREGMTGGRGGKA